MLSSDILNIGLTVATMSLFFVNSISKKKSNCISITENDEKKRKSFSSSSCNYVIKNEHNKLKIELKTRDKFILKKKVYKFAIITYYFYAINQQLLLSFIFFEDRNSFGTISVF